MAITVNTNIQGQEATSVCTYGYLYEPLVVAIDESDLLALKILVDIEVVDTDNNTIIVETLVEYAEYDISVGQLLTIDLMKLARQHHDANLFKFATINDILLNGWSSVVSKYKYRFKIYSDKTTTPVVVYKLPIIGGRLKKDFTPVVSQSIPLTEAEVAGVDLTDRWCNYETLTTVLADPTAENSRPSIESSNPIDDNTFYVGIDEDESSQVAVDDDEQTEFVGIII